MKLKIVILAGGQGTRMKSKIPKVLHEVLGKPMLDHVIEASTELTDSKPIVVVGHMADMVREHLEDKAEIAVQEEQLGTGHAVMMAEHHIEDEDQVLILCGDTPLIKKETLENMIIIKEKGYKAVVLSAIVDNPTGYGRIIRDEKNEFQKIIEQKDANEEQRNVREINAGMYIIDGKLLKENLSKLSVNNAQREYYLTDILEHIKNDGQEVGIFQTDNIQIMGVNSRLQLSEAQKIMRQEIINIHMSNGVTFISPENTYIDKDVQIGRDTIIYQNTYIKGNTIIGEDCIIRENTTIENCKIEDEVTIKSSTLISSVVGSKTTIGPYAYLRPNTILGENVKIGDFVELKNAKLGNGSKASHLAYIGDAVIGKNVNIGCGVVFVNYDGKNKFTTVVEDDAFIGSNSNLVAPVTVKQGAYIATGSTVTIDVPENSLCVARAREVIKEGWRNKKGL